MFTKEELELIESSLYSKIIDSNFTLLRNGLEDSEQKAEKQKNQDLRLLMTKVGEIKRKM
jgi:hypothetical protein